ncbi:glycosyltransferase family 4 protein [Kocuria sp. CPCC 205292]|uniref:glycosyltransferase family 4 protein n=1 Tax=Kocuria cellulosilytica TaxID=3071451 RepID=UPI0034D70569
MNGIKLRVFGMLPIGHARRNVEAVDMNLLRVLTLASKTGAYGGPFDTASRQAQIASDAGMTVELVAGTFAGDAPDCQSATYKKIFVPIRKMGVHGKFATALSVAIVVELWKAVGRAQIVHISFSRELIPIVAALFSVLRGRRLILQPHGMLTSRSSWIHQTLDLGVRKLYARAATVIALTERESSQLALWSCRPEVEVVALGNPVPPHAKARIRELGSQVSATFIARLHPRKNVGTFLDAAALMTAQQNLKFTVVGPDEGDLHKVRAALRDIPNLQYLGAVDAQKVLDVLDVSDVFVLTSHNEPWGNVLATALSMGIPVIVNKSSALSYAINEYDAGAVVPDGKAGSLAAALKRLTSDPDYYANCSSNALRLSENLLDRQVQKSNLLRIYTGK